MNFIESAKKIRPTLVESFKPTEDEKYAAILRRGASFGIAAGLVLLKNSVETRCSRSFTIWICGGSFYPRSRNTH